MTSASYLYLCGITFKNYHNNLLQDLLIGIGVNVAVEHAIVRPTLWVIIAILFSFSERACSYFEDIERQTAQ